MTGVGLNRYKYGNRQLYFKEYYVNTVVRNKKSYTRIYKKSNTGTYSI